MVIEKSTAFRNPDDAMDILQESFNRMLHPYSVTINFKRLSKNETFWNAVNEIRNKFKDKVTRVQFDFKPEKQVKDDGSFTFRLMQWANLFADGSSLTMNINDDNRLKKVEDDLTKMSQLCYQNKDYNLTVKFHDFGLFRYGQNLKAQYGLEDEIIENFICKAKQTYMYDEGSNQDNELFEWFNKVNILFKDYGEDSFVGKKRNRRGRM